MISFFQKFALVRVPVRGSHNENLHALCLGIGFFAGVYHDDIAPGNFVSLVFHANNAGAAENETDLLAYAVP